ncbi:hypothetical protein [Desertivirga arenae]|uniref:hypothetical protein n=1 Tax=Desertivirga arenae TaxID=2810309 RepID=UPI001A9606E0|nr:hypothetical protein [Pedobacter sp. SYSU D00823]
MKLIKQVSLYYQEGTSDKVYEIDLLQTGQDYVVNFRYGKRGSTLKEGTKTIFPVVLSEAEKVFDSLEQEKRKKGYVAVGEAMGLVSESSSDSVRKPSKKEKLILKYLKAALAGEEPENWRISRIIWRAAELKITEAVPSILKLADEEDDFNLYSVVWALGRMKAEKGLSFLKELISDHRTAEHVAELAKDALLELSTDKDREILLETYIKSLPDNFYQPIANNYYQELEKQIEEFLFNLQTTSNQYIVTLYRLSRYNHRVRKIFLEVLPKIPFKPNYFKHIRKVFKAAEMLEDYEVFGILAKEIERQNPSYGSFSAKTKDYLSRRVFRSLRRSGNDQSESYTELATGILLAFSDAVDNSAPFENTRYISNYNEQTRRYSYDTVVSHYDSYARFKSFYYILYANSSRYELADIAWKCIPPYLPGATAPEQREEAFPSLWNRSPEQVIKLLKETKARRVQEFALKVFNANSSFESELSKEDVIAFLNAFFSETQQLGLTLVRKIFNPRDPDKNLLLAVLQSRLNEAREQGYQWISADRLNLLSDTNFVADLIKINNPDTHLWLRGLLTGNAFQKEEADVIIARLISWLVQRADLEDQTEYYDLVTDTLVIAFQENLKYISLSVITELLNHKSVTLHELAGKILIKHEIKPEELPEDLLLTLLSSQEEGPRTLGIQLLSKFPLDILLEKKNLLVSFCLSPLQDVRNAVKPLIARVNGAYPDFGKDLIRLFVPAFTLKESYEGLHEDLLSLLTSELKDNLQILDKDQTLQLLNARYRTAQKLGAFVLLNYIDKEGLTIPEVVKLADNPLEEVRMLAWNWYSEHLQLVKADKNDSIRITDSEWKDTKAFAFDYFRKQCNEDDWTVEILVSICDSIQEDVQAFGREMITRCFKTEQGQEYLLKLSQHPDTKIQLFTTTYLEVFAKDNLEVISSLQLYFLTILSQVNKGKAAKARVLEFLRKEALKSEEAAQLIVEIFNRISASVAITEKAACIQALREIQKAYPQVGSATVVNQYPDYIRN